MYIYKFFCMEKLILSLFVSNLLFLMSCGQNPPAGKEQSPMANGDVIVGGRCEGCEAIYESTVKFDQLSSTATLPDFDEPGEKLEISGIVYKANGTTPATDIILYVYHTDQNGLYSSKTGEGWEKRHGYVRGWLKTDAAGRYKILTLRPAPYPGGEAPAHIHPVIKEEGKSAYWIDEFVFDDDPNINSSYRAGMQSRGGSGILHLVKDGEKYKATRNIILGANIPAYPTDQ